MEAEREGLRACRSANSERASANLFGMWGKQATRGREYVHAYIGRSGSGSREAYNKRQACKPGMPNRQETRNGNAGRDVQ